MADYDVVVVGASFAGCATVTLLGRAKARRPTGLIALQQLSHPVAS